MKRRHRDWKVSTSKVAALAPCLLRLHRRSQHHRFPLQDPRRANLGRPLLALGELSPLLVRFDLRRRMSDNSRKPRRASRCASRSRRRHAYRHDNNATVNRMDLPLRLRECPLEPLAMWRFGRDLGWKFPRSETSSARRMSFSRDQA